MGIERYMGKDPDRQFPNIYEEVYYFVNKLFQPDSYYKYKKLNKDIADYLYCRFDFTFKDDKIDLFRYLENDQHLPCHIIEITKEIDPKEKINNITPIGFMSKNGIYHKIILIPEKYLFTGLSNEKRLRAFANIYDALLSGFLNKLGKTDTIFKYMMSQGIYILAAFTMVENNICSIEKLPDLSGSNYTWSNWSEIFEIPMIDILINMINFKKEDVK